MMWLLKNALLSLFCIFIWHLLAIPEWSICCRIWGRRLLTEHARFCCASHHFCREITSLALLGFFLICSSKDQALKIITHINAITLGKPSRWKVQLLGVGKWQHCYSPCNLSSALLGSKWACTIFPAGCHFILQKCAAKQLFNISFNFITESVVPYLICCTSTKSFCGLGAFLLPVFICFCTVLITTVYVYFKTEAKSVFSTHPRDLEAVTPCFKDRGQKHKKVSYFGPNRKTCHRQGCRLLPFCIISIFHSLEALYAAWFPSGKSRHKLYLWRPQSIIISEAVMFWHCTVFLCNSSALFSIEQNHNRRDYDQWQPEQMSWWTGIIES